MLARLCSKSFKLGISSTWTKNFQMYKMDSEEAAEPVIKLPTFFGSSRNQRSSRNTSTSASLTTLKPLTVDHNKLWKIHKQMGVIDHLISLLRNLYVGQEATVRILHGTTDWFQIGKVVWPGCILSSCLFNLHAEYIRRSARAMNHKLETRSPGEISTTSDMQTIPL